MAAFALFSNWLDTTTYMLLNQNIIEAIARTAQAFDKKIVVTEI